jgi:hypothetical protein
MPVKYLPVPNVTMTINRNVFNMAVSMVLYTQLKCLGVLLHATPKPFLLAKGEHAIEVAVFLYISYDLHCGCK